MLFEEEDFEKLDLPVNWHIWTDKNHRGYKVEFPILMQPILTFSPANTATGFQVPRKAEDRFSQKNKTKKQ